MNRVSAWWLVPAGTSLVAIFVALGLFADLERRIPLFLALYAAAFGAYLVGVVAAGRSEHTRRTLGFILLFGILARLVLVASTPAMSTDIYRYVWEGRVILDGHNPFAITPGDSSLAHLRDENFARINHPRMETIYPPVAQGVFALGALFTNTVAALKLLFIVFDIAVVLVLIALLRARGQPSTLAIVYAWSPLVIFETAHSGHMDAVGIFFLMLGLLWFERGRKVAGAASLGFAFASKYASALLVPYFALRRRDVRWIGLALALVLVCYLPFAGAGMKIFSSLLVYSREWEFNGLAYRVTQSLVGDGLTARGILALLLVGIVFATARRQGDLLRYAFIALAAGLLLAPTLYPWYLAWVVPFLCIFPNRAWIMFTGLVMLSYGVLPHFAATGEWRLPAALIAIEYAPFYLLLTAGWLRQRPRRV